MQGTGYHAAVVDAVGDANVIVWDGDWLKTESFTSVIPDWLAVDPSRLAVAFRKAEGKTQGLVDSWAPRADVTSRVVIALVEAPSVQRHEDELRTLGVAESEVHNTALGWLVVRTSGCMRVVTVGGGKTCVNEVQACLASVKSGGKIP
eukprot:1911222-Prymnesium_polylepis.1